MADPAMSEGREALFRQFGKCLNDLAGRYITAEDMGTSVQDVMVMREITQYAAGYALAEGGSGDPSPWTARGVFNAIQAACERKYDSADLTDKKVTVQGVGHVGMYLLKMLRDAGAIVTVCDTNEAAVQQAHSEYGALVSDLDAIYDVDCDIFAPCAIGQTVNPDTLPRLKCAIIAGAANNQLSDSSVYSTIEERGVLYCPDFVINSGGVISVGGERIEGGWNEAWTTEKVKNIANTTHRILEEAQKRSKFPEIVAVELANERIKEAQAKQH